ASRSRSALRLRARVAGAGAVAAATLLLRHPMVELRSARPHRLAGNEPPAASGGRTMSESANELRGRNLRTPAALAALFSLFLMPLVLAFFIYYGTGWRPAARVNHGTLITPPRPLPQTSLAQLVPQSAANAPPLFHGKWSLVYVGNGACDADCHATLYLMRQ